MAWPVIAAAAIGAAGSVGGALVAAHSAQEANRQNRYAQLRDMKFQERMSNTAHQREVADLRAAGLNPLLSANSGASSPPGAGMAPAQSQGDFGISEAGSKVADAILTNAKLNNETKVADASAENLQSSAELNRAQAAVSLQNAKLAGAKVPVAELEAEFWKTVAPYGQQIMKYLTDMVGSAPDMKKNFQEWINGMSTKLENLGVHAIDGLPLPRDIGKKASSIVRELEAAGRKPVELLKQFFSGPVQESAVGGVRYGGKFSAKSYSEVDKTHYGDTGARAWGPPGTVRDAVQRSRWARGVRLSE